MYCRGMRLSKRSDLIIQRLFSEILQGTKGADGKLPSALHISKEYGISTASVREGLKVLESIGIVTMSHGRGIFVESRDALIEDLLGARKLLECHNAAETARRRNTQDIANLQSLLSEMDEAIANGHVDIYSGLDHELHLLVSELAGNTILRKTTESIRFFLYYQQVDVSRTPEMLEDSHAAHHRLVDAIVAGDSARAADVMAEHLDHVNSWWRSVVEEKSCPTTSGPPDRQELNSI